MNLRRHKGITLVELMIVVAVVALLLSLAVPSYTGFVLRSNRSEAINEVLDLAACQERIYLRLNQYDVNRCEASALSTNGLYQLGMTTSNANQNYTITATPQGGQTNDTCGNLTLTDQGVRDVSATSDTTKIANCWKGRGI